MKRLLPLILLLNTVAFAQTDSLSTNVRQSKLEHSFFVEVLGAGIIGSVGYNSSLVLRRSIFTAGIGIGGRYFQPKQSNFFLYYLGLKYSYKFNQKWSLNLFYNYGYAKNLYGVFKDEDLSLIDYCYTNHLSTSSCVENFWYHNYGVSTDFRLHKKLGFEVGLSSFNLFIISQNRIKLWPSFKVKYRL